MLFETTCIEQNVAEKARPPRLAFAAFVCPLAAAVPVATVYFSVSVTL